MGQAGLADLDAWTAGLQAGDLVVLAARPSMGKTALAMQIAAHAGLIRRIPAAVFRLVGALLAEVDDEWQVHRRYFSKDSMRQLYEPDFTDSAEPTPLRLAPVR